MTPTHLWKDDTLHQSEQLIDIYKNKLIELSMYEHAKNHISNSSGATGGRDADETKKHFAERFLTSSARTQFVVIDPRNDFEEISIDLKATFGSGYISVLDIPAGTGAGILSLLANLFELRSHGTFPKLPLYINIVAGDYSISALQIYTDLLNSAKEKLEEQSIFIKYDIFEWDASDGASTNLLIRRFLEDASQYEEHYVFMSAFSGVGSSNYKSFQRSFEFIQTALSHLNTTILYIEPNMNEANRFLRFIKKIHKFSPWFNKEADKATAKDARFKWYDPITDNVAKSDVILQQYSRV